MEASQTQLCSSCGYEFPITTMIYGEGAQLVCASCEADVEMKKAVSGSAKQLMFGPPVLALFGTLTICFPIINLAAPGILGLLAFLGAIAAFRHGLGQNVGSDSPDSTRTVLIVSACLAGLWGMGLMGIQLLSWLGFAASV